MGAPTIYFNCELSFHVFMSSFVNSEELTYKPPPWQFSLLGVKITVLFLKAVKGGGTGALKVVN